ncbi:hypothetical protein [Kitasatospora brasiliensis]|uniref:hypothetical protein n=1 Tax=Kitasatospora brasiliensis TaxID=3058040 RepID=UPI00293033CC|nr:hypothetical protein [Kitasatospora sp. K002]
MSLPHSAGSAEDQLSVVDSLITSPFPEREGTVFHLPVWRVPSTGRWVGLTVAQTDRELPFELLTPIGDDSCLPAEAPRTPTRPGSQIHADRIQRARSTDRSLWSPAPWPWRR